MEGVNHVFRNIKAKTLKFTTSWIGALMAETPENAPMFEKSKIDNDSVRDREYNITLNRLMLWAVKMDVQRKLPKYDFLVAFTGYNMMDKGEFMGGSSFLGSICRRDNKATIHYENIATAIKHVSHELGHAFGAIHDGDTEKCKRREDLMMASSYAGLSLKDYYVFSNCSVNQIENYVWGLDENCLENSGQEFNAGRERDIFSQVYPGQIYDLNEQCRLMYGNESSYVGDDSKGTYSRLKCTIGGSKIGVMDGTTCSNGAWCLKGICTPDSRVPRAPEHCIKSDSKLPLELESAELQCKDLVNENRELCENETVKSHCCLTCNNINNQTWNGKCHDATDECASLEPRDCYNEYYATACCNTCRNLVKNPSDANCLYGDKGVNCSSLVPEVCHISTRYCCQTCADYLTPTTLPTSSINNTTTYSETTNVSKIFNALLTDSENGSKTTSLPSTTSSPKKLCPKKQTQKIPAAN